MNFAFFRVIGITLHVILAGPASGKPLMFLHGFPEFWFAWRRQIDHFVSLGYRVIIPDQRGYNLSDKPAGIARYSIDLLAKDVVDILDDIAGSKAFLVRHGWGVAVTWHLAARYSEKVSRAAMLSVPHPRVFIKNLFMNASGYIKCEDQTPPIPLVAVELDLVPVSSRTIVPDLRWIVGGGFAIVFLLVECVRGVLSG